MRDYRDYIADMKRKWTGKRVLFEGVAYTVVDVDYNGGLLIDKPARFTETTSVPETMISVIGEESA
ncbi:MAG: hypothetical protein IKP40_09085 [Clostridia bacterium]|nr:hypothetical protein [Clostridia bacterium]